MSQRFQPAAARRFLASYPADLSGTCLAALLLGLGVWVTPPESALRVLLALPLLLVLPGYALIGALFPRGGREASDLRADALDLAERLGLAFGASLALLALVGVALGSLLRFDLATITITYVVATVVLAQIGAFRRLRVPETARYHVPIGEWVGRATDQRGLNRIATPVLAVAVLAAVGALAFGLAAPHVGASYTGMTLLGGDNATAADYPSTVEPGDPAPVAVQVSNHEGRSVEYTLVVQVQRLEDGSVTDRREVGRLSRRIAPGETVRLSSDASLPDAYAGQRVRLTYLLYRGDAPDTATRSSAYRQTHVWVTVANASS